MYVALVWPNTFEVVTLGHATCFQSLMCMQFNWRCVKYQKYLLETLNRCNIKGAGAFFFHSMFPNVKISGGKDSKAKLKTKTKQVFW